MGVEQSRQLTPAEQHRRERLRRRFKEQESQYRRLRQKVRDDNRDHVASRHNSQSRPARPASRDASRHSGIGVEGERNPRAAMVPMPEIPTWWTIRLGAEIPNFNCKTTQGNFKLHDFCTGDAECPWTLLFSHPKDFTPICTTELGLAHLMMPQFRAHGVKMIGVSCDPVESHKEWMKDICAYSKIPGRMVDYPLIEDTTREIVTLLGMLDPKEKDSADIPLPARAVIILDEKCKVRLSLLYPATTGRDFDEILRTVKSLKLTSNNGLGTPANWKPGERCIVTPAVKSEDAKIRFKNFEIKKLPSEKPYLRLVDCPVDPNYSGVPERKRVSVVADSNERPSEGFGRAGTGKWGRGQTETTLPGSVKSSPNPSREQSADYVHSKSRKSQEYTLPAFNNEAQQDDTNTYNYGYDFE